MRKEAIYQSSGLSVLYIPTPRRMVAQPGELGVRTHGRASYIITKRGDDDWSDAYTGRP